MFTLVKKKDSIYKYQFRALNVQVFLQENFDAMVLIRFTDKHARVSFTMQCQELKNPLWYLMQNMDDAGGLYEELEDLTDLVTRWTEILLLLHTLDRLGEEAKHPSSDYIQELCTAFRVQNDKNAPNKLSKILMEELTGFEEFKEYASFTKA